VQRTLVKVAGVLAAAALGVAAGSAIPQAGAAQRAGGQRLVMQTSFDVPVGGSGLVYAKLHNATTGGSKLTSRLSISSLTIAQEGGSQPLEVILRAATCDNANGFGALEAVVVPQDQTVHLDYPAAFRMPFVATLPASWCLYAATVPAGGRLLVSLVGTTL